MLDTILGFIGLTAPVATLAWAFHKAKDDCKFVGYDRKEVALMNKSLAGKDDFELSIEELSYTFRRDLNESLLQMRADNTELFLKYSREITSS